MVLLALLAIFGTTVFSWFLLLSWLDHEDDKLRLMD